MQISVQMSPRTDSYVIVGDPSSSTGSATDREVPPQVAVPENAEPGTGVTSAPLPVSSMVRSHSDELYGSPSLEASAMAAACALKSESPSISRRILTAVEHDTGTTEEPLSTSPSRDLTSTTLAETGDNQHGSGSNPRGTASVRDQNPDNRPGNPKAGSVGPPSLGTQLKSSKFGVFMEAISVVDESVRTCFTLPQIIVIGDECAGKSSLLESITKCPVFPRDIHRCTKIPIRLRLLKVENKEQAKILVTCEGQPMWQLTSRDSILGAVTLMMAVETSALPTGSSLVFDKEIVVHIFDVSVHSLYQSRGVSLPLIEHLMSMHVVSLVSFSNRSNQSPFPFAIRSLKFLASISGTSDYGESSTLKPCFSTQDRMSDHTIAY